MPFEPISPIGGFTGELEHPEPPRFSDVNPETRHFQPPEDSLMDAAFRIDNTIGSSGASEAVRYEREQMGIFGGPVPLDPDFDPWAEIAGTPYEPYYEQLGMAANKEHFAAIKADIDRENKDRDTVARSGWTGIAASMAAGTLDVPILIPGGAIIRSAKGGVSLLGTAATTAAAGTIAAAGSEAALHASQQLRTGGESAMVIGGSTVLAGLLGAGFGKLFSKAELARISQQVEKDFRVPGPNEDDPFSVGGMRVEAAPGSSAQAQSVADAIRQTATDILPPSVRVQVVDEISAGSGQFGLRDNKGTISLKAIRDDDMPEGMRHFEIHQPGTLQPGFINGNVNPRNSKDLVISSIEMPGSSNSLGDTNVREILRQIKKAYPEFETVSGTRLTGARQKAGVAVDQSYARIRLPDTNEVDRFALRGYHGSPHTFDRFDAARIGSGEGTGMEGHGFYLSDNLREGQTYRIQLGADQVRVGGKPIGDDLELQQLTAAKINGGDSYGRSMEEILSGAEEMLTRAKASASANRQQFIDEAEAYLAKVKKVKDGDVAPGGALYEVDIDAEAGDFLNIFAPMREQPEILTKVRKAYRDAGVDDAEIDGLQGSDAYDNLAEALGGQKQASDALAKVGIAGNRYLSGESTNFVVFDPAKLKILKRNGEAVSAAERKKAVDEMLGVRRGDEAFSLRGGQTETPEFKRWFGDSKVVDENGKPLVVYHGTNAEFDAFDPGRIGEGDEGWMGAGFYFSADPKWTEQFGQNKMAVHLKLENPFLMDNFSPDTFERIQKLKGFKEWWARTPEQSFPFISQAILNKGAKEFSDLLERAGYDGIVTAGEHGRPDFRGEIVVFEPTQIKSAIGNRGTFDPNDPRIQHSLRAGEGKPVIEGKFDADQSLITISAHALDPAKTLRHEAVHALRSLGLFTGKEWKTLEAAATKQGWMESHNVRALYEEIYAGRVEGDEAFSIRSGFAESKVVDDQGAPKVVYHGTQSEFAEFDFNKASKTSMGVVWFTDDQAEAMVHASNRNRKGQRRIVEAYLDFRNPLVVDAGGKDIPSNMGMVSKALRDAAENGNDGLIFRNARDAGDGPPSTIYAAFEPKQIKILPETQTRASGEGKAAASSIADLPPRLRDMLLEEAIAEQYSLWKQGVSKVSGTVAKLFQRMRDFLERTGNALRGQGFRTADDVFSSIDAGRVAARAGETLPGLPGAAPGISRGASVGAAARDPVENTLKSAFGMEKATAFAVPELRLFTSKSDVTKRYAQELFESALTWQKNKAGNESAPLGTELGSPGAVETRVKFWTAPLADAVRAVDNAFLMYRKGRQKRMVGELSATTLKDTIFGTNALTYRAFKEEISKAMRNGDTHQIPEIASTAKQIRALILDPLKDEAIALKLLPEDVTPETAASYLNRIYNRERIVAERDQFKSVIRDWLTETENSNAAVRGRISPLLEQKQDLEARIRKAEKQIERRSRTAEQVEAARQEASRLNQFAFSRAAKLSEPLDQVRARIETISRSVQQQLDQIDELTAGIRAQKETLPELVNIERQMQSVSRALSDLNRRADLVDAVDVADEIDEGIASLVASFRAAIGQLSVDARAARATPEAEALRGLERARSRLGTQIRPYRQELRRLRREQRTLEARNRPKAREGAVFETKIRGRVNKLSDQASGKRAAVDDLQRQLDDRQARLDAVNKAIEDEINAYQGKSAREAQSALSSRSRADSARTPEQRAKQPRLKSADKPVFRAARRIANQLDKEPGEIDDLADQIIDRIIGTPDGRLPYDAHLDTQTTGGVSKQVRGPLAARVFMIPDKLIEPWLENDIDMLLRTYVRTMAPDVELTKRFGSADMTLQMKEITEDYAKRSAAAKTPKERKKINDRKNADIRDLAAVRDRLRGTYALPSDPDALMVRAGRVVGAWNFMRMLGGMTVSAIPDLARPIMVHGMMRTFGDGMFPLLANWSNARLAMREVKMAGTALDMVLDSRAMRIADVMDEFGRHTKFERAVHSGSRNFGVVSLMAPWNAAVKQFVGLVTMSRILKATDALARGKIRPKEMEALAASGISTGNAVRIAEQMRKHGVKQGGVWQPNTHLWDADARPAMEAFRAALVRDVDRIVVTPGIADRPLWMSSELGRLIGQFKSFALASMQKTTISGLQQADANVLAGAALMIGLGGLVHVIKARSGDHDPGIPKQWGNNDETAQFMVNAVDRSGLTGWLMEINNMSEKMSRGTVGLSALTGKQVGRYASRNLTGSMLGPGAGTFEDFARVTGSTVSGEWNQTDSKIMKRLLPYNNVFYLRSIFDNAQKGLDERFGVPERTAR